MFSESAFPTLPSPLGQILATVPYFERLPVKDRVSMVGLLVATIDWYVHVCMTFHLMSIAHLNQNVTFSFVTVTLF